MTIKNTEEIELQQLHPRREISFTNVTPVSVEIQIPVKDRGVTIAGKAETVIVYYYVQKITLLTAKKENIRA